MEGFIWNGIHSDEMGIIVEKLPTITRPEERVNKYIIPGRSGHLTIIDNAFESEVKSVEFHLIDTSPNVIKQWLTGSGKVIFGNDEDRFYKARIVNKIDLEKMITILHKGIALFDCQPFGYFNEGENYISIDKTTSIYNPGTYKSEPYIKIYGTGDLTIRINDNSIQLKEVEDYIELDTEIMECFKGTEPLNNKMVGEFPYFISGENKITWDGNVSKIEIKGRWRSL